MGAPFPLDHDTAFASDTLHGLVAAGQDGGVTIAAVIVSLLLVAEFSFAP